MLGSTSLSKPQGATDEKVEDEEVDEFLTDYDFRHRLGTMPGQKRTSQALRALIKEAY